jgi:5-methylcytosine-specific restriction endonuclease McrA
MPGRPPRDNIVDMATLPITPEQRRAALQRYGYRCALCGTTRNLQVHHKRARSKFGKKESGQAHDLENLEVLCARCHHDEHGLATRKEVEKR